MKVVILAAGEGTRLRPYTLEKPKCMVEIEQTSLLDIQLSVLKTESISNIFIVGGYKSEMLQRPEVKLLINPRYFETNMVWTLDCALGEVEGDVLIAYGDIAYSRTVLQRLLESKHDIAVSIDMDWEAYWRARGEAPLDDAETLKMDSNFRLNEIGKKPVSLDQIESQYMGLIKLTEHGLQQVKHAVSKAREGQLLQGKKLENAYMTDLLQSLIDSDVPVYGVPVEGGWVEIDTVGDLKLAMTKQRINEIKQAV